MHKKPLNISYITNDCHMLLHVTNHEENELRQTSENEHRTKFSVDPDQPYPKFSIYFLYKAGFKSFTNVLNHMF